MRGRAVGRAGGLHVALLWAHGTGRLRLGTGVGAAWFGLGGICAEEGSCLSADRVSQTPMV